MLGVYIMLAFYCILLIAIIALAIISKRNRNKNKDKQNMAKANKRKRTAEELAELEKTKEAILRLMDKKELDMEYKSACIVNSNEQPVILSSDKEFKNHSLNLGNGISLGFPTKMIPYLMKSLGMLFIKNSISHYGDKDKAKDEFMKLAADLEDKVDYFDLNDETPQPCGDPLCPACSGSDSNCNSGEVKDNLVEREVHEKLADLYSKNMNKVVDMEPEEHLEMMDKLDTMREVVEEAQETLEKNPTLSREQQEELREATNEKLKEHLKEIEFKLTGKVENRNKEVTLQTVIDAFNKYGEMAAKEELMRVPEEKRDEFLAQMIPIFAGKKNNDKK